MVHRKQTRNWSLMRMECSPFRSSFNASRRFLGGPLCASAPDLVQRNEELYRWLTLVDALRVGRARDRSLAGDILEQELQPGRDQ